jgi:hypothetical protein
VNKYFQKTAILALSIASFFGIKQFCYKQTDGFALNKICSRLPADPRWECSAEPQLAALDQSFRYLGKGAQCYVFVSQDQQYVIKFFRVSHIEAPGWLKHLPLPAYLDKLRQQKIAVKDMKRVKDFSSYLFAYENLRAETGLIYLHLSKTAHLKKKLQIIDKIGVAHSLNLDEMEFILQRRATPFYSGMQAMIHAGEIEQAKTALSQLVHLLSKRHQAGLTDKDPDLKTNFGLIGTMPVQFDVGRFKKRAPNKKPEPFQQEVIRITDHFKQWLLQKEPELAHYLESEIQAIAEDV